MTPPQLLAFGVAVLLGSLVAVIWGLIARARKPAPAVAAPEASTHAVVLHVPHNKHAKAAAASSGRFARATGAEPRGSGTYVVAASDASAACVAALQRVAAAHHAAQRAIDAGRANALDAAGVHAARSAAHASAVSTAAAAAATPGVSAPLLATLASGSSHVLGNCSQNNCWSCDECYVGDCCVCTEHCGGCDPLTPNPDCRCCPPPPVTCDDAANFSVVLARNNNTRVGCVVPNSVALFVAPGTGITYWLPAAQAPGVPGAVVPSPDVGSSVNGVDGATYVLTSQSVLVGGSAPPVPRASGTLMQFTEATGALVDVPAIPTFVES